MKLKKVAICPNIFEVSQKDGTPSGCLGDVNKYSSVGFLGNLITAEERGVKYEAKDNLGEE